MKESWKPGTMLSPVPAVLISCGNADGQNNLFTASWVGTICTQPPMVYVSIRPERYSHAIIKNTGEFVINLTTQSMAYATDWCGVKSGRDCDKWKESGLTQGKSHIVSAPYVEESPLAMECRVKEIRELGSHDMFIAEVVNVLVDDKYIDSKTGKLDLIQAGILAYAHGEYFGLGDFIGYFGWSLKKGNDPVVRRK